MGIETAIGSGAAAHPRAPAPLRRRAGLRGVRRRRDARAAHHVLAGLGEDGAAARLEQRQAGAGQALAARARQASAEIGPVSSWFTVMLVAAALPATKAATRGVASTAAAASLLMPP